MFNKILERSFFAFAICILAFIPELNILKSFSGFFHLDGENSLGILFIMPFLLILNIIIGILIALFFPEKKNKQNLIKFSLVMVAVVLIFLLLVSLFLLIA